MPFGSAAEEDDDGRPAWVSRVAHNRDHFAKAVCVVTLATGRKHFYKFGFALQQPIHVSLSPLDEVEFYFPIGQGAAASSADRVRWRWAWIVRSGSGGVLGADLLVFGR